jgi:carboxyl-terminal processing protease
MNNTTKTILVILVAMMLLVASFGTGALFGVAVKSQTFGKLIRTPESTIAPMLPTQQSQAASTPIVAELTPTEQIDLFKPFWESWKLLHENYVDQPLDDLKLMRGAISGMLSATGDKHTSYMDPDQFKQANTSMEVNTKVLAPGWIPPGSTFRSFPR